ncbi:hypothetical protein CANARDRAFT_6943 [[Candida] arabinofermentans NRRL YB-2248]|uniref:Uncharacterized protein n=1 Tax=[Candida] arabinofermentans NRRL YB-2248 TaxID=983967 RepID=A0A1E4T3Y6_9ASCO|nr:hypothetical protein CANARDRAFT_6943 [[Candida] arabinofermentans NRRL YB-2248]
MITTRKALNFLRPSLSIVRNRPLSSIIGSRYASSIPPNDGNSGIKTTKRPLSAHNGKYKAFNRDDQQLMDSIEEAVNSGNYQKAKIPLSMKLALFVVPFVVSIGGYIIYNTYQGKLVFLPIWFTKTLPLEKAQGIESVDIEKLKVKAKDVVLSKLSMNEKVKETFGLPLKLGTFQKFDVTIEYQNFNMEGFQIDCTKSWFKPEIKYCQREIIKLQEKLNRFLEPMTTEGGLEFESIEDLFPNGASIRDYNIIIRGRINVLHNENSMIDEGTGDITFMGVIEFDHTKTIKLVSVILSSVEGGIPRVEKLW